MQFRSNRRALILDTERPWPNHEKRRLETLELGGKHRHNPPAPIYRPLGTIRRTAECLITSVTKCNRLVRQAFSATLSTSPSRNVASVYVGRLDSRSLVSNLHVLQVQVHMYKSVCIPPSSKKEYSHDTQSANRPRLTVFFTCTVIHSKTTYLDKMQTSFTSLVLLALPLITPAAALPASTSMLPFLRPVLHRRTCTLT